MTRVCIVQSNYLPWRGYFDLIAKCDLMVVYDSVQYTVNDWRNRNRLKGPSGPMWITVPVRTKGRTGQRVRDAEVVDHSWVRAHRNTVQSALGRARYWGWMADGLAGAWETAATASHLHVVNRSFIDAVIRLLELPTAVVEDVDVLRDGDRTLTPSARVAEVVARVGGSSYLTGPAGLDYLVPGDFADRGVRLEVIDYGSLQPYPQQFGPWLDGMSVLDLLANVGPGSRSHLTSSVRGTT